MSMLHPQKPAAAAIAALMLCAMSAAPAQASPEVGLQQAGLQQAIVRQNTAASSTKVAQIVEQRNVLLEEDLVTSNGTVAAGTRISSYLVAISGNDAGSISFRTPVLAVITDQQALASPLLGKADSSNVSLSNFATPQTPRSPPVAKRSHIS